MDSQLPKIKRFISISLILSIVFFSLPCNAGEVDLDLFGFTYHLHRKGAVRNAPLKMDHAGVKVFNPGLGLGYDFRTDIHTEGWSPVIHGGLFENCNNHPFTFVGAGGRFRKYITKKHFWEFNALATLTYGNDSENKHYKLVPLPYANVGFGTDYGKYLVTYNLSYVPKDNGSKITSSTDMLFLSIGISF